MLPQELFAFVGRKIGEASFEHGHVGEPILRHVLHQRHEIRRAAFVDAASEYIGREGEADQRGVAAVAATDDGDFVGIGNFLFDGPIHGVDQIVVHLSGPLFVGGVGELFSEAA